MNDHPCKHEAEISQMGKDLAVLASFVQSSVYWRGVVVACVISCATMAFTFWGAYNRLELTVQYKCGGLVDAGKPGVAYASTGIPEER